MRKCENMKILAASAVWFAVASAFAFQPIPKASARALGVTKTRSFSSGLVFVNGKVIPPPYVVERWGTGIRINQIPVTGQIIDWNEFLKTQSGVKVEKTEVAEESGAAPSAEVPAAAPAAVEPSASSLDDLFDDDPKPAAKPAAVRAPVVPVRKPSAPKASVTYSLDGSFVPNDASKALLKRINQSRMDIDNILRSGGFICFGNDYPRITADSRTLSDLLDKLPELQQQATDEESFIASVHAAGLVYLNEVLIKELYRNRVDYLKLRKIRRSLKGVLDFL